METHNVYMIQKAYLRMARIARITTSPLRVSEKWEYSGDIDKDARRRSCLAVCL